MGTAIATPIRARAFRSRFTAPPPATDSHRISARRHQHGPAPCNCKLCQAARTGWPAYYVGSKGIAWECFLEDAPLDDEKPGIRDEAWAIAEGLSIVTPKRRPRVKCYVMREICPICEGLKMSGDKYCLGCACLIKNGIDPRKA